MQPPVLEQIRNSITKRRSALAQWLGQSPTDIRATRLGPAEESAVKAHLRTLEECIDEAETGTLGLCTVCHDFVNPRLLVADYTASVCLDHLSPEEASVLERELELAQLVQQAMLPAEAPRIPGLQLAAFTRPAQIIGGDYFDFLTFEGGEPGWIIGDAAGHGVSASLHMAGIQALSRAVAPTSPGPAQAANHIHRLFVRNSRFSTFVSLFLAAYDSSTHTLRYCNAGHNPPLLLHGEDRDPSWLQPTGPAIGLVEEGIYTEKEMRLDHGDLLVMYTDGIVEACDPDGLALEASGLAEIVRELRASDASEVIHGVTYALEEFLGGRAPEDDLTLLVAHVE